MALRFGQDATLKERKYHMRLPFLWQSAHSYGMVSHLTQRVSQLVFALLQHIRRSIIEAW